MIVLITTDLMLAFLKPAVISWSSRKEWQWFSLYLDLTEQKSQHRSCPASILFSWHVKDDQFEINESLPCIMLPPVNPSNL